MYMRGTAVALLLSSLPPTLFIIPLRSPTMTTVDTSNIKINVVPAETELHDVMKGASRWDVPIHEHGSVALVDVMPRLAPVGQTADFAIVQAARVSYGAGTKKVSEDTGLIRYLLRHQHTTPFEMVEFKFHCVMREKNLFIINDYNTAMFIARQWIRHRTANVNEYSARYSVVKDRFYHPSVSDIRKQSTLNRQGGDEVIDEQTAADFLQYLDDTEAHYAKYEELLSKGVSRELARIGLPVSVYTEWYWKIDLHNLFRFLALRMDSHAQKEIQDYAVAMFALIQPIVPVAAAAFLDYTFGGVTLSRLEIEALRSGQPLDTTNKREGTEWEEKRKLFGLGVVVEATSHADHQSNGLH